MLETEHRLLLLRGRGGVPWLELRSAEKIISSVKCQRAAGAKIFGIQGGAGGEGGGEFTSWTKIWAKKNHQYPQRADNTQDVFGTSPRHNA